MNETAPTDSTATSAHRPGGRVDLDTVNSLQLAVMERARAEGMKGQWLPNMSTAQWIVSGIVALIFVAGIFRVVDGGLTAFQKFTEVYTQGVPEPPAAPAPLPEVDLTKPVPIILVPGTREMPEPADSSQTP